MKKQIHAQSILFLLILVLFLAASVQPCFADETVYSTQDGKEWVKEDENTWTKTDSEGNPYIILKIKGNVWEYSFNVKAPDAVYYAWEEDVPQGYEIADGKGTRSNPILINSKEKADDVINNKPEDEKKTYYGNLFLSKQVGLDDEKDKVFHFRVELSSQDSDIQKLISGNISFGNIPFADGKAYIDLKAGETASMTNIPAGVSFTVTETDSPQYDTTITTNDGKQTSGKSLTGTIAADQTMSIIFTNISKEKEKPAEGTITLSKTVINGKTGDKFSYTASLWGLKPSASYLAVISEKNGGKADVPYKANESGSASLDFSLKDGDSVLFSGIPEKAKYQFTEKKAEGYIPSFRLTSGSNPSGESAGRTSEGSLTTKRGTIELISPGVADNVNIAFTNEQTGGYSVLKKTENGDDGDIFSFQSVMKGLKPSATYHARLTGQGNVGRDFSFKTGASGTGILEFSLKNGERIDFSGLPAGSVYQVKEDASEGYTASYEITEAENTVNAAGKNPYPNTDLTTSPETVDLADEKTEHALITFTNRKEAPASGSFTVVKTVTGGAGNDSFRFLTRLKGLKASGDYTAIITTKDGNVREQTYSSDNTGSASMSFLLEDGDSAFFRNLPPGARYKVMEYGTERYMSSYRITGEGVISARESEENTIEGASLSTAEETVDNRPDGNGEAAVITFSNTYQDTGGKGILTVSKKNKGGDPDDSFILEVNFRGLRPGYTYTPAITRTDGSVEEPRMTATMDGEGYLSFSLKEGDQIRFGELPVGTLFQVTEDGSDGYISSYRILGDDISAKKESGLAEHPGDDLSTAEETIAAKEDGSAQQAEVCYTNIRTGSFAVKKTVEGKEGDTDSFHFTVKMSGLIPGRTYRAEKKKQDGSSEEINIVSGGDGTGQAEFDLMDKEETLFEEIPVGASYTVQEKGTVYYLSAFKIDGTKVKAAEYSRTSTSEGTDLTTSSETLDLGESAAVTFTNQYKPEGCLLISKEVAGNYADQNQSFLFTITLTRNGKPVTGTYHFDVTKGNLDGSITFDSAGKGSVSLRQGQTICIPGIPAGTTYKIEEEEEKYWTQAADDESDPLTGTIKAYLDTHVTMVNTYDGGTAALTVKKVVTGNMGSKDEKFRFRLTLEKYRDLDDSRVPDQITAEKGGKAQVISGKSGVFEFELSDGETIRFTDIPTGLLYTIKEEESPDKGYQVSVRQKAGSGEEWTKAGDGEQRPFEEATTVEYTNDYRIFIPTGVHMDIKIAVSFVIIALAAGIFLQRNFCRRIKQSD